MNPFVDFNNIRKKDAEEIASLLRQGAGDTPERHMIQPVMENFMKWLQTTLHSIQERLIGKRGEDGDLFPHVGIDYDPKQEPDRFLRDIWCAQSDNWALIETIQAYYLTMMTIIEKIQLPDDKHLMLASLGSGPGLYETFLAKTFGSTGVGGVISCIDFAAEMTELHKFVLSLEKPRLCNIEPKTGDMSDIPLPSKSQDAVLCNNSLQWCTKWQKAISEMARILDPDRKPWAYIIVHLHKQPMHVRTHEGECPVDMQPVFVPEIMDELEKNMFSIISSRQLHGGKDTGQAGGGFDRVLLKAEYTPWGLRHNWRKAQRTMSNPMLLRMNKKK